MENGYYSIQEVMDLLHIQKSKVYSLKDDPKISNFLGHDLRWEKTPNTVFYKEDIDSLKKYFDKSEMKVICFTMFKGGVGKTISSATVGSLLASEGYKTLLIDLDFTQTNLTNDFKVDGEGNEIDFSGRTIYEMFAMTKTPEEVIFETRLENLYIIPGNVRLSEYVTETARRNFLKKKIEKLNFDYIIIDTPPSIGDATYWALNASTHLLIPSKPDRYSIEGIEGVLKTINISKDDNPRLKLLGIFTTQLMRKTNAAELMQELTQSKTLPFLNIVIPYRQDVVNACNNYQTILEYNPSSEVVDAYKEIVKVILDE